MVSFGELRGHRGVFIAAGVAAATMLAVALAWHLLEAGQPEFAEDPKEEHIEPDYHPGGRSCDPSAIGPFHAGEPFSDSVACQEAREEHRLKANDLIQQRRAANAAAASAYLSHFQTLLGIVGMGFGFLTLCAAVAAAIYAKKAAHAAEDAVKHAKSAARAGWKTVKQAKAATIAAQEAVGVTREIGQAQVRAYISVSAELPKGLALDESLKVGLRIRNTGQSPAHSVMCQAMLVVRASEFDGNEDFTALKPLNTLPIIGDNLGIIPSGSYTETIARCQIISARDFPAKRISDGYDCFVVVAVITYRDVFNKVSRRTRYCAILEDAHHQPNLMTPGDWEFRWQPTRYHNDAT